MRMGLGWEHVWGSMYQSTLLRDIRLEQMPLERVELTGTLFLEIGL